MTPVDATRTRKATRSSAAAASGGDPAALAETPKTDSLGVDRLEHREGVLHLQLEAAPGRGARRLALPAAVEGDDADAGGRQHLVQMLVQEVVPGSLSRSVQRDEGGLARRRIARGERDVAALDA